MWSGEHVATLNTRTSSIKRGCDDTDQHRKTRFSVTRPRANCRLIQIHLLRTWHCQSDPTFNIFVVCNTIFLNTLTMCSEHIDILFNNNSTIKLSSDFAVQMHTQYSYVIMRCLVNYTERWWIIDKLNLNYHNSRGSPVIINDKSFVAYLSTE